MTRFVDLIGDLLTTWTNLGRTPQIIKLRRGTKRKSVNEGITLEDTTDDVVLATNGSEIFAKRNGTLEIYARSTSDADKIYKDVMSNFFGHPIVYSDLDSPDIKKRYKFILQVSYTES